MFFVKIVCAASRLDRLQAFVQRSKKSPVDAVAETVDVTLKEIRANYGLPHSRDGEIEGIFAQVLAFAVKNELVGYY